MKTKLILLLLSFFSIGGNAQEFKHFEMEIFPPDSVLVRLTPISRVDPAPTDVVGRFKQTKNYREYHQKIIEIAKRIFTPEKIPTEVKNASGMYIYMDKNKKVMEISYIIRKKLLEYTTEQQWLDLSNQVKAISLDPYIEIPNKENFDFAAISEFFFERDPRELEEMNRPPKIFMPIKKVK